MIEIEFSALTQLCLKRRIPTMSELEREVWALVAERMAKRISITWQFTIDTARSKLNSHYVKVRSDNQKFQIT
jgi:hypothetical protein